MRIPERIKPTEKRDGNYRLILINRIVVQANPLPEDTAQSPSSGLDNIADQVKKAWNSASDTLHEKMGQWMNETNLNDTIEKAKTFLNQAGEQIRKEAEKIGDKLQD